MRVRTHVLPSFAFVLAGALALPALAGRPLATEDADVLERGTCEWEAFAARETASGTPAARAGATQVGCGVGANAQVALAYGRASSAGVSVPAWTLGGKLGLVPRKDDSPGLTLAWALSAEKAPGQSLRHEGSLLNLVATKELAGGLLGHANLGWARSESAGDSTALWNLALEWSARPGLELMGEVYGEERGKPWVGAGVRWALADTLNVNASYAVRSETPRVKLWTLGFKLTF